MQKYFLVSLLAAAGMVYGCGYDKGEDVDHEEEQNNNGNKEEDTDLLAMPDTCKSNLDCMDVNGKIIGDCIENTCQRFCREGKSANDCTKDTICEAGLCRPIIDCPDVTLENESKGKNYKNRKCIKIFRTTPSVNWSQLLKGDLTFSYDNTNNLLADKDFTSKNYTFELPHSVIDRGVNFSMVTYLAVQYLKLMIVSASKVAECVKPSDLGSYKAKYQYGFNDDGISTAAMINVCQKATDDMDIDLKNYIEKIQAGPCSASGGKISCVIEEYKNSMRSNPACTEAINGLDLVREFSTILMQMGKTSASSSATYQGSNLMRNWLLTILKNNDGTFWNNEKPETEFSYALGRFDKSVLPDKGEDIKLECASDGKDCYLGAYPLNYCVEELYKGNINSNKNLYDSLYAEIDPDSDKDNKEKMKEKIKQVNKEYFDSTQRIRYCSEVDVNNVSSQNSQGEFKNTKLEFNIDYNEENADIASEKLLKDYIMMSQLGTCIYMMNGTREFALMRAMGKSPDVKLGTCGTHQYLKEATVNTGDLKGGYDILFSFMDDLGKALSSPKAITQNMSSMMNLEGLYSNATDPKYIWLSGDSFFPLVINNNSGDYQRHDLLLEVNYNAKKEMFASNTTTARIPLTEQINWLSYQDSDIVINSDEDLAKDPSKDLYELKDGKHDYVSTFSYTNPSNDQESHAVVLYKKAENQGCPKGKCTFYWKGHKAEESSDGMICGGINLVVNHIDGYVMLKDSDVAGTKEAVSPEETAQQ